MIVRGMVSYHALRTVAIIIAMCKTLNSQEMNCRHTANNEKDTDPITSWSLGIILSTNLSITLNGTSMLNTDTGIVLFVQ